jgi:hypothetical protein
MVLGALVPHEDERLITISEDWNDPITLMLPFVAFMEDAMSKIGFLSATALAFTLAVAAPAVAQQAHVGGGAHIGGGMHAGGGMRSGGAMGGGSAFHGGGTFRSSGAFNAQSNGFRGAQASIGTGRNVAVNGAAVNNNFVGRNGGQFTQSRVGNDGFRDRGFRHHRGFGAGAGFVAGLAAGSALGYGYSDPYYYDDYAYNDTYYNDGYYDDGSAGVSVVTSGVDDPAYCAQRYKSYDPASGTYLGYDGLRHPCS